jgi:hypothetical protein
MLTLDIRFLSRIASRLCIQLAGFPSLLLEDEKSVSNATGKRAAFPPRRSLAVALPKAINDELESRHSANRPRCVRKVANRFELFNQKRKIRTVAARSGKTAGSAVDRV